MVCDVCHADNPEGNRFCGNCGSPLLQTCPNCSATNSPTARFCGQCGTELAPVLTAATPVAASERRLVTVLFADLTGYTTFAESRDHEEVRDILGRYFEAARKEVERFGGIVEKFIGDAVMAVWGAEVANEDDAERAVRTGFELIDIVAKLSADIGAPDLSLRVGVHTGEAAVGPAEDHMGFVTGDLVNTASRLQAVAEPGTVLVGDPTKKAASSSIVFEPTVAQTLKGKSLPVTAWRALRVVSERRGRGRTDMLEPPFVGRANELRLLKDLLETVDEESGARMVSLVGEAGIGKSRLVWELLKYVDGLADTVYWHEGRSPSYGDGVTFWAVAEMIKARAGIVEGDEGIRLDKLDEALATYVPDPVDRNWVRPRLAALLGLGEAPPGDRAELNSAIRTFFEGVAELGTTVLVFEDLHWADPALLELVEELPDWWRSKPILIITLARPDLLERRPSWGTGRRGVISMTLGSMSEREMSELVTETVPGLPDHAVQSIVSRSAGVPLYAVELLRSLLAEGDLEGESGVYRVVGDITDIAVPESIQAVVGARLDRLDADQRALVQDAAVLGQSFSIYGLAALTGRSPADVESLLQGLTRREIVEPIRDARSPERGQFQFLQGLTRDVALGRMSKESRRARHLAVAEYLEKQADPELAVVVAAHYLQALDASRAGEEREALRVKALGSIADAADRAANLRAFEQVLSIAEKGLEIAETDQERAPFWEKMVGASGSEADVENAERYGNLALDHYRGVGDQGSVYMTARGLGHAYAILGHPTDAVQLLGPLLDECEDVSQDPELARLAEIQARAVMLEGRPQDSLTAADRALEATEALGLVPETVDALITKATVLGHLGRLTEARILLEGAISLADRHNLLRSTARGRNNLAYILVGIDAPGAERVSIEAYEAALRSGERSYIMFQTAQRGELHFAKGEFEAMEELLDDPLLHDPPPEPAIWLTNLRMSAAAWRGDLPLARTLHERIQASGSEVSDPQTLMALDRADVEMMLFDGDLEAAFEKSLEKTAHYWSEAQGAMEIALLAAALLGRRDHLTRWTTTMHRHLPRFAEILGFGEALVEATEDERAVRRLETSIAEFEAQGWLVVTVIAATAASRFLPPEAAAPYREKAEDIAGSRGWLGFIGLLERHPIAGAPSSKESVPH